MTTDILSDLVITKVYSVSTLYTPENTKLNCFLTEQTLSVQFCGLSDYKKTGDDIQSITPVHKIHTVKRGRKLLIAAVETILGEAVFDSEVAGIGFRSGA